MRRKRLNHFGDAVIGILTGYNVLMDYRYFAEHGEGEYILNLLTCELTFNGKKILPFPVFEILQKWFDNEIGTYGIDKRLLETATVRLRVGSPRSEEKIWTMTRKWPFFKRAIRVNSFGTKIDLILKTDEKDYSKSATGAIWT